MTILCVDFMNQAHRARSGFQLGPAPVVFNFFRQFKSLVSQFSPNRIYVVLEGHPAARYQLLPEYKATRKVSEDDPKYAELQKFFLQKDIIVNLLTKNFPVTVVRHPHFECDDTIYNLIKRGSTAIPWIIASNDSDFTQILQEFNHVKLWNPMKKEFASAPDDYDYVTWKSLRGDGSDNIPGIPGIGDKTAIEIASDPDELKKFLSVEENARQFQRNYELISFKKWTEEEAFELSSSLPRKDWDSVRSLFESYDFKSLTKEDSWLKFVSTFDRLWN